MGVDVLHGTDNVAQLANAGRLDQDAVRMISLHDLFQRLTEVAHQGAADAAGVQLVDLNASLTHKAAVNADLAEFVFDQHQLFAYIALTDQLLNQSGFTGAQKAGEYCNFCHCILHFFLFNVSIRNAFFRLRRSIRRRYCILFSIAQFPGRCKGFSGGFFGFIVNR